MSLVPAFDSVFGQAPASPGDTVIDYLNQSGNDLRLYSVQLLLANHQQHDFGKIEIIDKDNVWGEGLNAVVATLINKWTFNPTQSAQTLPTFVENQAVPSGFVVRLTYTSLGQGPVDITANLQLYAYVG